MAHDPADRYQSADAAESALGRCRSAGDWSAADAAAWWRTAGGKPAERVATPIPAADVPTDVLVRPG